MMYFWGKPLPEPELPPSPPLLNYAALATVAVALSIVLVFAARVLFHYATRPAYAGTASVTSIRALQLLRKECKCESGVSHSWYRCEAGADTAGPVSCYVCHRVVDPYYGAASCCEVCGVGAHKKCAKKAPRDCRPVSVRGHVAQHHWVPDGAVLERVDHTLPPGQVQATDGSAPRSLCVVCTEPCGPQYAPLDPSWSCAWCNGSVHAECFLRHSGHASRLDHFLDPQGSDAKAAQSRKSGRRSQRRRAARQRSSHGVDHPSPRTTSVDAAPKAAADVASAAEPSPAGAARAKPGDDEGEWVTVTRKGSRVVSTNEAHAASDALPPRPAPLRVAPQVLDLDASGGGSPRQYVASDTEAELDGKSPRASARERLPQPSTLRSMSTLGSQLEAATGKNTPKGLVPLSPDVCLGGGHRVLVLPPTCVELAPPLAGASGTTIWARCASNGSASRPDAASGRKQRRARAKRSSASQPAGNGNGGSPSVDAAPPLVRVVGGLLPVSGTPTLVFLNTKSGPQVGGPLRRRFLKALNPIQVVELPREDPEVALRAMRGVPSLRILVVGGDGTIAWILDTLERIDHGPLKPGSEADAAAEFEMRDQPAVGILPLGTGNDLARCTNWGGSVAAFLQRGLATVLRDIASATPVPLDRWRLSVTSSERAAAAKGAGGGAPPPPLRLMNNYLGIGVDAKVALDFHAMRHARPDWFKSQFGNKMWYTGLGSIDILDHSCGSLPQDLELIVDGRRVFIPPGTEGVLVLNISSHSGGVDMWGTGLDPARGTPARGWLPASMSDGVLEVVGVKGSLHLGQLQVGISRATRLAQGSVIEANVRRKIPMQLDGEPWLQPVGSLRIDLHSRVPVLRRPKSAEAGAALTAALAVLSEFEERGHMPRQLREEIAAAITSRVAASV